MINNQQFSFHYYHRELGRLRIECFINKAGACRVTAIYGASAGEHYTGLTYRKGVYSAREAWFNKGARLAELLAFINDDPALLNAIALELSLTATFYAKAADKAWQRCALNGGAS